MEGRERDTFLHVPTHISAEESMMKCIECSHEAGIRDFRYLYNARVDASVTLRQCPHCQNWLAVDELTGEVLQKVGAGEAPWGKSAGIEDLAVDAQ